MSEDTVVDQTVDTPDGPDVETVAREQGWTPKEEYKGDLNRWKTAEEFVEFGERVTPIIKRQRDEFKAELRATQDKLAAQEKAVSQLLEFRSQKEKQEYEGQITFLKQQLKLARRQGEEDTVDVLQDQLEDLQAKKPDFTPPAPAAPAVDMRPFDDWKAENEWFEKDSALTRQALGIAQELRAAKPNLVGDAFFKEVTKELKRDFPEKFNKRAAMVESAVNTGTRPAAAGSYARLPREAQDACDEFVSAKLGSQADYVKLYFGK